MSTIDRLMQGLAAANRTAAADDAPQASKMLYPGGYRSRSMYLQPDNRVLYCDTQTPEQQAVVESNPPEQVFEGFVRVFDLSDPSDLAQCERVWDLVGKEYARVTHCETQFSQAKGSFIMLLVWYEGYAEFKSDFRKRIVRSATGQVSFVRPWTER